MPWGRSEQEYAGMFDLTSGDLSGNPLDCAAGLANFNAEVTAEGREAVSCDPLYNFTPTDILARIEATFNTMVENTRPARHEFVWREFGSPEQLGESRMAAMRRSLTDFPGTLREGRYCVQALPHLDFRNGAFDAALCPHFLFTYSEHLVTLDFHVGRDRGDVAGALAGRGCFLSSRVMGRGCLTFSQ